MRNTTFRTACCSAALATAIAFTGLTRAQPAPGDASDRPATPPRPMIDDHGMNRDRGMMGRGPHDRLLNETFGATVRPLPRDQAQTNEVKPGVGLVVEEVKPGSPAEKGGLKQGDVIFQVGDQWVINAPQLATLLSIQDPDDNFELKVRRGSERVDLDYKFDKTALDGMAAALSAPPAMGEMDNPTQRELSRPGDDNTNRPMPNDANDGMKH